MVGPGRPAGAVCVTLPGDCAHRMPPKPVCSSLAGALLAAEAPVACAAAASASSFASASGVRSVSSGSGSTGLAQMAVTVSISRRTTRRTARLSSVASASAASRAARARCAKHAADARVKARLTTTASTTTRAVTLGFPPTGLYTSRPPASPSTPSSEALTRGSVGSQTSQATGQLRIISSVAHSRFRTAGVSRDRRTHADVSWQAPVDTESMSDFGQ
mmetsp:Transcript_25322/g.74358  ORF Transcript_25322/g.74358 Transcript_25322/m.74358 type:complete len:218 (+) Transcript_25322:139-792(+)